MKKQLVAIAVRRAVTVLAFVCLVARCERTEQAAGRKSTAEPASASMNEINPFSVDDGPREIVSQCVHGHFDLQRNNSTFTRAVLNVRNECSTPIAILTTPTEVRVRRTAADRFPEQTSFTGANATFYVARKTVGLSADMFLGDGGRVSYAPPGYATVPAGGSVQIPIVDAGRLMIDVAPGEAVLTLLTSAIPMASYQPHMNEIDLGADADAFNRRHAGTNHVPFRLSRRAHQISFSSAY